VKWHGAEFERDTNDDENQAERRRERCPLFADQGYPDRRKLERPGHAVDQ
jgi:hypothetical protein